MKKLEKKNKCVYKSPRLELLEVLLEQVIAASHPVEMEKDGKMEEQWVEEELVYDDDILLRIYYN